MNLNYNILNNTAIFESIEEKDIKTMLNCMSAKLNFYKKDNFIFMAGDEINFIGIVLKGSISIIKDNENGEINIVDKLEVGDCFGEAFVCSKNAKANVSIIAIEPCEILHLQYKKMITTCSNACAFHTKLIENLLSLMANKIIFMNERLELASKRKTREKLYSFLQQQSEKHNSSKFKISYNREQLANFLFVERSAMSNELCKMRDDGIIKFYKNEFELL